jgi:phenylalanyl-tRNA synthetase beta chain
LADFVELPDGLSATDLADALVRVGLEVERVEAGGAIAGPLVLGRVQAFTDEPQKNGKTIRWCLVDVGAHNIGGEPRGIVCGALNFAVGDLVVVALPGAVLPGGLAIGARRTYGHVSDGMICSARELAVGEDAAGILVLAPGSGSPGADALDLLGLREAVLEISVTPDRGYCLSLRGLAREAAIALDVGFRDVAEMYRPPQPDGAGHPVVVADVAGCPQFSMREVSGLDPTRPTPEWMQRRLRQARMRPISLAVDVTNYVMLETGQPLHAYDGTRVRGAINVRRAAAGEHLTTLDGADRALDPDDLLIADDSGPIGLAGVMGGASTEIGAATSDVLLEAACFTPGVIARAVRRHRLPSEAAKRFERGVDPAAAGVALQRCVELLVEHGGARPAAGYTVVGDGPAAATITMSGELPARIAGMPIPTAVVRRRLRQVGCTVSDDEPLRVGAPSWRPDLTIPADLVEEVVRLEGYQALPATLPAPQPGGGLTERQRFERAVSRAVAAAGCTEVLSHPFVSPMVHDTFGLSADDPRRRAARVANPLSEAEPELRTSLLPGLLTVLLRNVGRGIRDLALFEIGLVFTAPQDPSPAPEPGVAHPPSVGELAAMEAALPEQRRHVGAVLCGEIEPKGWWGAGRAADWSDAVQLARVVADTARVELSTTSAELAPWHPGRCAELLVGDIVVGHAGELHPRVVAALGLPERTCAVELDLSVFSPPPPAAAPAISVFPPVLLDVALVVEDAVTAAGVQAALRDGAGELLESVRLFDVFTDPQRLGAGRRSLAFSLRFRAPGRTLTVEEAAAARDAAVALAHERTGATLRR